MSTGLDTWSQNLLEIGPLFPFAGTEWLWVIIGVGSWLIWHALQVRHETSVYEEDVERYLNTPEKIEAAMDVSLAETVYEQAQRKESFKKLSR